MICQSSFFVFDFPTLYSVHNSKLSTGGDEGIPVCDFAVSESCLWPAWSK